MKEVASLLGEVMKAPANTWRAILLFAFTTHVAWACGLLEPHLSGFAWAADVDRMQTEIERKLSRLESSQNMLLRIAIAQEVCRLYQLRNASGDGSLQRQLQQSLFEKQEEYFSLTGQRYPVVECAPGTN